jgi:hypothetical protein
MGPGPALVTMHHNDRRGESAYSPALLDIDAHCGQTRRSAPTAWTIVVRADMPVCPTAWTIVVFGVGRRHALAREIWVMIWGMRAGVKEAKHVRAFHIWNPVVHAHMLRCRSARRGGARDRLFRARDRLLRASDRLLRASDRLLRASDRLLRASDRLLRASDRLLRASDRLLRASDRLTRYAVGQLSGTSSTPSELFWRIDEGRRTKDERRIADLRLSSSVFRPIRIARTEY